MPRKTVTAAGLALALALALATCATPTPEVIVVTATPPGADTLPAEMLGVEWQLYSVLESEPAAQSIIPEPQRYTIQFTAEGTAAIRADCNDVFGNYTIQGSNMTITLGPTTLAFCGEESGDHIYMAALGQVSSYSLSDRGMQLAVSDDATRLSYLEAKDVIDLPEEPGGVDITADVSLQIRTGPGLQFRIAHRALQGDQGEVVGQSPDDLYWVVLFPEDHPHYDQGWVRKSETSISNPGNEEIPVITPPLLNPTVEVTPPESSEPQATVGQVAAVMTGPGNDYQIWGLTSIGADVVITGKSGNFWQIQLPTSYAASGEGWVRDAYLTTRNVGNVQNVPNVPPPDLEARPTASGGSQAAVRFKEKTAVRAGPDSSYNTYFEAEKDWVMGIIGESTDRKWWVVNLPTQTASVGFGWIPMDKTVCSKCDIPSPYTPKFRNP